MGKLKELIEKIKAAIAQVRAKLSAHPLLAKLFKPVKEPEQKAPDSTNPTILFKEGGVFTRLQLIVVVALLICAGGGIWISTKLIFDRLQKNKSLQANSTKYQNQLEELNQRVRDNASIISLGQFTTNTWNSRNEKIKVQLDLWARFSDPDTAAYADKISIKVNDRISQALARLDEAKIGLMDDHGKAAFREEVKRQVEPLLRQGKLIDVYFHNLVAQ